MHYPIFLFHIQYQAFQILAFGMIDVYWMVGWLMKLMKNSNASAALCRSCKHRHAELVFIHRLRATEGKQYSARLNLLESLGI